MIKFLSETLVPNYIDSPEVYSTFSLGKISHIAYYYWILKNAGFKNIELITDTDKIEDDDIVFFYEADRASIPLPYTKLDIGKRITKIQVVGDTNLKSEADFYAINDWSFEDTTKFYLQFPLPVGLINSPKFKPNWPPKIFGCACHSFNIHPDFKKKKNIKKFEDNNIELYLEHTVNYIQRPIDVHFFIRNPYQHLMFNHDGSLKHPIQGFKHPNRLYQSWYMGVPSIFNDNSSMNFVRYHESDYLVANDVEQFIEQAIRLKTDEDLFDSLVRRGEYYKDISGIDNHSMIIAGLKFHIKRLTGYELV